MDLEVVAEVCLSQEDTIAVLVRAAKLLGVLVVRLHVAIQLVPRGKHLFTILLITTESYMKKHPHTN